MILKKLQIKCFLFLLVISLTVHAQQREVTGRVTSQEDELGIPGVAISEKGTTRGTITDLNGDYEILADEGTVLIFSYVGMISQEIPVGNNTRIDVVMEQDIMGLEEVVVVGYGTQKKSDLTGSVVSIKSDQVNAIPTTNVAEMIRGRAPGVEVSLGSARPGGNSNIMIRGRNSLSGGNNPLFIIDGMPVEASDINDMNSRDISSIEILKDASAQAIYGARASNGVVLITTKRGSEGKVVVSYDMYAGLQTFYKNFEVYDAAEWLEYRRQGLRSDASISYPPVDTMQNWIDYFPNEAILDNVMLRAWENKEFIDWEELVLDNAWMHQHDLSLRLGTEKQRLVASFGYYDQDGIRPESGFVRGSLRLNFDQKVTDWLTLGGNTYFSRSKQQRETDNYYFEDFIFLPPLAEPRDENGELQLYVTQDDRHRNPLFNNQESDRNVLRNRILLNLFTDIEILKGVKYRLNASIQSINSLDKAYLSTRHEKGLQYAVEGGNGGEATIENITKFEYLLENIITIDKDIGSNHHLDVTLMQGVNERQYERLTTIVRNFNSDILGYDGIANGTIILPPETRQTMRRMVSFMGRIRYDFLDKYLLTLTGRLDGSSVFGPNNKYGFFPSVAFAWKLHEESFFQNINYINNLKIRASYGSIGNEAISPYRTQALTQSKAYTFGNDLVIVGYLPGPLNFPNIDLKWETSTTFNSGLDFGFLGGRIQGSFEYYTTFTNNLLIDKMVPSATGYTEIITNLGKTSNRGIETFLQVHLISNTNFNWSVNGAFSRNRNEIIEATVDKYGKPVDDEANKWFIGYPINVEYYYDFDGIWQRDEDNSLMPSARPGDVKLEDLNGDGEITPGDDRQIIILDPDWYGNFGTTLRFRNFDLDALFDVKQGSVKRNSLLYNGEYGAFRPVSNAIKQPYWTPENPVNTHPRPYYEGTQSPYKRAIGYQEASYFRLRSLTVGYNFPVALVDRINISSLRIYLRGTNLFTVTDYLSYSPEATPDEYPEGKVYSFGLNVTF